VKNREIIESMTREIKYLREALKYRGGTDTYRNLIANADAAASARAAAADDALFSHAKKAIKSADLAGLKVFLQANVGIDTPYNSGVVKLIEAELDKRGYYWFITQGSIINVDYKP